MSQLRIASVNGVLWSGLERFGSQLTLLVTQMILARLLNPTIFGLVGLSMIFVNFSTILISSGLGSSIVQKKKITENDLSTAFYVCVLLSVVLYLIILFFSDIFSDIFSSPELSIYVPVLSLNIIIASLGVVHNNLLIRNVDFKSISFIGVVSSILSSCFGIIIALFGGGIIALIVQILSLNIIRLFLLYYKCKWKPKTVFSFDSFIDLYNFGWKILASSILDVVYDSFFTFVIGRYYSINKLGLYTQANKLQQVPSTTIASVIGSVTFSVMSKLQEDFDRLKESYIRVLSMNVFICIPLMFFMILFAHPLITITFGQKWDGAIVFFQILSVGAMFYPLKNICLSFFNAIGRSDVYLKINLIEKIVMTIGIFSSFYFGLNFLVVVQSLCKLLVFLVSVIYIRKIFNVSFFDHLKVFVFPFITSFFIIFIVFNLGVNHSNIALLILQVLLFCFLFLSICFIIKPKVFLEVKNLFMQYVFKSKNND